jgi:peptidyl-prolyl cis-trans isomerase A (cyclophilin A)
MKFYIHCFLLLLGLGSGITVQAANPQVEFQTNYGNFVVELYPDKAPKTVANFMQYLDNKFYEGTIFHRVVNRFVIQGGGLTPELKEKSALAPIPNESNNGLKNEPGTLALARAFEPDSGAAQFFINLTDNKFLNYYKPDPHYIGYCVFGRVISGMDAVERIGQLSTHKVGQLTDVPNETVLIQKVALLEKPVVAENLANMPAEKVAKPSTSVKKGKKRG